MTSQVQTVPFMLTRRSSRPPPSAELARYRARLRACQVAFAVVIGLVVTLFSVELRAVHLGAPLPFSIPEFPSF